MSPMKVEDNGIQTESLTLKVIHNPFSFFNLPFQNGIEHE